MNSTVLKRIVPLLVLALAACDDPYGPGFWDATPDTVVIYSASRPEYIGFASAIDVVSVPVVALPIEAPGVSGAWDFVLTDEGAGLSLVPSAAFEGLGSRARIAVYPNTGLDEITRAPGDTARYTTQSVPLQQNSLYVIRSRRISCGGGTGYVYAKLAPVGIDVTAGTFRFEIVRNPYCENRSFIPPTN